jgi:hypothetical protein
MSGGTYGYFEHKWEYFVDEFAKNTVFVEDELERAERNALSVIFQNIGELIHAIEWCDSADTSWDDVRPIVEKTFSTDLLLDSYVKNLEREISSANKMLKKYKNRV